MKLYSSSCAIFLSLLITLSVQAQDLPRFRAQNGLAIVEMESLIIPDAWQVDTTTLGYTGSSYLNYRGSNLFNTPGTHKMVAEILIDKPGRYRFQWRSLIAQGSSNTEHNDSWLRCRDASDFYAERGGQRVYPRGSGRTPNPEGSGKDGWFKVYQNNLGSWTWTANTSDNDPHQIFMEFDIVGTYTIEIAGRSQGHAIDRFVLYHSDVSSGSALNVNLPESERINTVNINMVVSQPLKSYPTVGQDIVSIDLPIHQSIQLELYDYSGRLMTLPLIEKHANKMNVHIAPLSKGWYIIQIQTKNELYYARFLKE